MFKKQLVISSVIYSVVSAMSAHAASHFYTGIQVGAGNDAFQLNNASTVSVNDEFGGDVTYDTPFSDFMSSVAFMGGVMMGYQKPISDHFNMNFELSAMGGAGASSVTDRVISPQTYNSFALQTYTTTTTMHLPFSMDFVIKPAIAFTEKLTGYLKAGPAYALLNTTTSIIHNNSLVDDVYSASGDNQTTDGVWGYVVGTGLEYAIYPRVSVYSEYALHQYQSKNLHTINITDNGTAVNSAYIENTVSYTRRVSPLVNAFVVGLHYYF